jgi:hypothetical protein
MIDHPFLADPERAAAFEQLAANPSGSIRGWAKLLGWEATKAKRFVQSLIRYGLADIQSCRHGSVFRPLSDPLGVAPRGATDRPTPPQTATHRHTSKPRHLAVLGAAAESSRPSLDTGLLDTGSRDADAKRLIGAMNEALGSSIGDSYVPVAEDNRGSHRAAEKLFVAGVPMDFAIAQLIRDARRFNPSRHGGGDIPRSVGFFVKGIITAWGRQREQLPLPRILTDVERSRPAQKLYKPEVPERVAAPETISQVMERLRAEVNSK